MSSTRTFRLPLALAVAVASGLLGAPAALASGAHVVTSPHVPGAMPKIFPSVTSTVVASKAANRSCIHGARSGASVARLSYTAPADGQLTAHLKGSSVRDDWDLALLDRKGARLDGSAAFFTNEVTKAFMRKGETVTIQACRLKGRAGRMPLQTTFVGVPLTTDATTPRIQLLKVRILGKAEYTRLEILAANNGLLDITHDVQDGRAMVIAYAPSLLEDLRAAGFVFEVVDADMAKTFRAERAKDRAYTQRMVEGSPLPSGRTEYRQIEDYYTELKKLVDENPQLVKPIVIKGKTAEGRDIPAVEIAKDVTSPAEGRPYFLLNGAHHAREWPANETPMEFAIDLVKGFKAGDPRVTKVLTESRVIVQPMTNIDGYKNSREAPIDPSPDGDGNGGLYNLTGASPGPGTNAYRRKNCNFPFPTVVPCELQLGIDPNRNYPESWGGPGASSNPHSQTWRGPSAGSEPEIKAVRELVSQFQITSLIAMHNVAALVLRPPGLEADGFAPDEEGLKALGDKMAEATGYTSQYGWQLYDTTGTTDDWAYAATGGYGYTIEVGPPGGEFHMNYETGVINQYLGADEYAGLGLREAFLLAAEHAFNPAGSGRIAGRAPAGRTLRIKKEFKTLSHPVCAVAELTAVTGADTHPDYCAGQGAIQETDEKVETTVTVPASGRFTYWTNPSTRPFTKKEGKTESFTLTCEDNGKVVETHQITIDRGQLIKLDMPCGGTLVEDAKPPVAKKNDKKALKKCMAKAKKAKGKAKRKKAQKACQKKYGRR
jgi:hypothetical protein